MTTLGMTVAADIANGLLSDYVKGDALKQTVQDKPLLRILMEHSETFPGGKDVVSSPVQGAFMSDNPGFLQGYSEDDQLTFNQAANLLRCAYSWYEMHSGLEITHTEFKKDGISFTEDDKQSEHKDAKVVRIVTSLIQNRIDDFGESWSRAINNTLWSDGSQDPKQTPGIFALLPDNPSAGTTGTLSRSTYPWWRHRVRVGGSAITASAENQTLTKTLRTENRQLRRYGGRPDYALCGSSFMDALELEVGEKGLYTQDGNWAKKKTDINIKGVTMSGKMGNVEFEYDPTLDDKGFAKRCYMFDSRRLRLRPMDTEWNKLITPARPYQYMVFFQSMICTFALECTQMNANGIYEIN